VLPWWIVDVALCLSLAAQLAEGLLGAWGWALRGRAWAAGRGRAKWRAERARHVTMRGVRPPTHPPLIPSGHAASLTLY
jgi:hypothetical protein